MKIGIDARLINETGVGRYIRNLIIELSQIDRDNSYVVYLRSGAFDDFELPNPRWEKRLADVPWHTVREQLAMPQLLVRDHLDLVHVPYFNTPIFYPGRVIVTIHDLTILHFDTGRASTLPLPLYKLRRLGYYLVLAVGLKRAQKIFAVSQATKNEIISHFDIPPEKVVVTKEAAGDRLTKIPASKRKLIADPYLLYVGNAYPHKNLEGLLEAYRQTDAKVKLVLVGEIDYFFKRLMDLVNSLGLKDRVVFFGQANEGQLSDLYAHAEALVFPSLMEGFGLPGLEAMSHGTPVACSDINVFHEIYGDAALYFDPLKPEDIGNKLKQILTDKKQSESLVIEGKRQVKKYSWKKMAEKTLEAYEGAASA